MRSGGAWVKIIGLVMIGAIAINIIQSMLIPWTVPNAISYLATKGYLSFSDAAGYIATPTGRTATYVIAASDATATEKAQADIVLTGTADQTIINNALFTYTNVEVLGLNIYTSGTIFLRKNHNDFTSSSKATITLANGSNCDIVSISAYPATIQKFFINGNKANQTTGNGITVDDTNFCQEVKIYEIDIFNAKVHGVYLVNQAWGYDNIIDCYIFGCGSDGLYDNGVGGITLSNVWAVLNGRYGFYFKGAAYLNSNFVYADQNIEHGIFFQGGGWDSLNNFSSSANGKYDLYVVSNTQSTFSHGSLYYRQATTKTVNCAANLFFYDCTGCVFDSITMINRPIDATVGYGVKISEYTPNYNNILSNCTINSQSGDLQIVEPQGSTVTNNKIKGNQLLGVVKYYYSSTAAQKYMERNNTFIDNYGYIVPSEIRTASGSLTGGAVNAILFAWHNPEVQDIFIKKVIINITTADADAANIDVGIADDATYTNGGTEFFNDLKGETIQVNDSLVTTEHTQTIWVFCQDSVSATDGWVVAKILDNDGTSIVGSWYIEYVGK